MDGSEDGVIAAAARWIWCQPEALLVTVEKAVEL